VNETEAVHTVRLVERDGVLGRVREIVKRVDRDNPAPADLDALRALMREEPWVARLLCDMASLTNHKIINSMMTQALGREALLSQATLRRDGLGYTAASEIERGLIEHAVTCWLRLQKAEMVYQQSGGVELTLPLADWHERRLAAAHGRYLRAVESLARVRRLTRPSAVQINVGDRQVNVAGVAMTEQQPSGN